ncbi:hypothetical protein B296_00023855, partial [Ensete ventricosum]
EIRRRNREARWEREGRSLGRRLEDLPQDCRRLPEYAGVVVALAVDATLAQAAHHLTCRQSLVQCRLVRRLPLFEAVSLVAVLPLPTSGHYLHELGQPIGQQ